MRSDLPRETTRAIALGAAEIPRFFEIVASYQLLSAQGGGQTGIGPAAAWVDVVDGGETLLSVVPCLPLGEVLVRGLRLYATCVYCHR
jgi:hypothetical protein